MTKSIVTATNHRMVFLSIAVTALEAHQRAWAGFMRSPADEGAQEKLHAFHQALIAIEFSCCYLESALFFYGRAKLGRYYQDTSVYETKLADLGITDERILAGVKQLRLVKRDLVQGRPLEIHNVEPSKNHIVQNEAEKAVALVLEVKRRLKDA